mmetsp:Transcript_59268/g.138804  ORF Transcript_59268/g.138804 Transcript_59268/m.138804 type:complete len:211 (-) Transcript_59268:114-746(-)
MRQSCHPLPSRKRGGKGHPLVLGRLRSSSGVLHAVDLGVEMLVFRLGDKPEHHVLLRRNRACLGDCIANVGRIRHRIWRFLACLLGSMGFPHPGGLVGWEAGGTSRTAISIPVVFAQRQCGARDDRGLAESVSTDSLPLHLSPVLWLRICWLELVAVREDPRVDIFLSGLQQAGICANLRDPPAHDCWLLPEWSQHVTSSGKVSWLPAYR